jgi:adenylate cyclase
MGDAGAASGYAREVLSRAPDFTVRAYLTTLHYQNKSDLEHHRDALLKAGLPA